MGSHAIASRGRRLDPATQGRNRALCPTGPRGDRNRLGDYLFENLLLAYPLDTSSPLRGAGHLLNKPKKQFTTGMRPAAVESKNKLIQIRDEVGLLDAPMVSAE